ncbi:putative amidophosphoribosyltransferase [Microbacterium endophyticum]|uniref:Putative amidophosphoribosyltransferase n=1 Tax=Microbacterium endophyticum TaxID=1526412 RepID=A0A7W4V3P3_9MICO|nr:phosphoribosyltransferase family protein [Microbacterium endophyticum]MBB2976307.1 putative amidophosphoribosyltransferase [Microbacterium endophyticum]NIK35187.1 putative amidophosphoribosyltransferase [Microbacterium endophyticum]
MAPIEISDSMRRAFADALTLLFPIECAGCGLHDVALCDLCRAELLPEPIVQETASGMRVCSGLAFAGVSARIVRAVKEEGKTATLVRALAPALRHAVDDICALSAGTSPDDVVIVPIPTSRAAMRRRGFRVVEMIGKCAGLAPRRILQLTRATVDQRELGRDERQRNVSDSMRASTAAGTRVLLIDDVVTSGATLDEGARAIRAAGGIPLGAATVAATPKWNEGEHAKRVGR